jgi:hypothetical protein
MRDRFVCLLLWGMCGLDKSRETVLSQSAQLHYYIYYSLTCMCMYPTGRTRECIKREVTEEIRGGKGDWV